MTHNAKKSVLYVNQNPADTMDEKRRGSIKLDFHTIVLRVKQRLDGTGHFEPFCLIMEIALLVFTASGPFRTQTNGQRWASQAKNGTGMGENRQM